MSGISVKLSSPSRIRFHINTQREKEMEVKFRTLTPIFTGDRRTNQSVQLRETGLNRLLALSGSSRCERYGLGSEDA